jgi:predicted nucleic acid-binding protein
VRQAIALARQLRADWLLTDDAAARLAAGSLGWSLGIVLWAAGTRYLTRADAECALERLAKSSLWVSRSILLEAKAALDKLY